MPAFFSHGNEFRIPAHRFFHKSSGTFSNDKYRPDILVITGHDAYSKHKGGVNDLSAYRHSKHFVETVQKARRKIYTGSSAWILTRDGELAKFAPALIKDSK
jgi:hypothetical protein